MELKVRFTEEPYEIERHGAWYDLRAMEDYSYVRGDELKINLGVNIAVPEGYEGILAARSSTADKYGVIQKNAPGVIDETYCGNDDIWKFSVLAFRDGEIKKGDRVCQFRIQKSMETLDFNVVSDMKCENRGGFGSSGVK